MPTHPEVLFITDAAINIFPDLKAKRDIIQNAIDFFTDLRWVTLAEQTDPVPF